MTLGVGIPEREWKKELEILEGSRHGNFQAL